MLIKQVGIKPEQATYLRTESSPEEFEYTYAPD